MSGSVLRTFWGLTHCLAPALVPKLPAPCYH